MKDCVHVDALTFDKIVKWVEGARNYAGTCEHNVDGTAHMIVQRDCSHIVVAETTHDDFSGELFYLVHNSVYQRWLKIFGYDIEV